MSKAMVTAAAMAAAVVTLVLGASAFSWQKVYEARDKGLPKTAIEELQPLIVDALANKRHAEAIKAIATRIALEGQVEGGKAEEKVARLQAELDQAPAEMKPLIRALLADWYWQYFRQNRWRFQQRTQTVEAPGTDFTTWDLPRLLAEVDRHFQAALADGRTLQATSIAQFDDLLEKGSEPDACRPTLFDFLTYEALAFYQAGEQGAAKAEDAFEVAAAGPVFAPVADFLAWQPESTDAEAPKLKAIVLFQKLLAFHRADADRTAFLEADMARLAFGRNQAVGPDRDERHKAALARFVADSSGCAVQARALAAWAELLKVEDPAEARTLAKRGVAAFPATWGGNLCHNLVQQIEARQVSISAERVWNEPWPTVAVDYKNLDRVFLRAVACDYEDLLARQRWNVRVQVNMMEWGERQKFIDRMIAAKPAAAWDAPLPPTTDFRSRIEQVGVPKDLQPGFYLIIASHDAAFGKEENQVSATFVWVSDLALVVRERPGQGALEGFVLRAKTGEPVEGASLRSWTRDQNGKLVAGPTTTTDADGRFRITGKDQQQFVLHAQKDGQAVASDNGFNLYRNDYRPDTGTVFFTDRSLYRPGQAIHYKGICHRVDQEKNAYAVLAGEAVRLSLRDPNDREIATAEHRTNDQGSFSGSFTAPASTLTGRLSIRVDGGPSGSTSVSVEEYKRPKFRVELAKPAEAARLGAEVRVPGTASAYTGAAIGGAKVSWRVVREVRFPSWCWWGWYCFPPGREASQNIAHGTGRTNADGSFAVAFTALPDLAVPETGEPTFSFTVYADVTDTTGETRSASQQLVAGYTALALTVVAEDWQTPDKAVAWTVEMKTLDGTPLAAEGTLAVYTLRQPDAVQRPALAPTRYDWWWFRSQPKNSEPKADPANPESWENGAQAASQAFTTDGSGKTIIETRLAAGIYRAVLTSKDRFGKPVTARRLVQVLDPAAERYPVRLASHVVGKAWSVEPGGTFTALWGTGYDTGRAYVELEQRGKTLRAFWTGQDRTQALVEQAVTEDLRGGFTVRVTYVRENRAFLVDRVVDVPWTNKKITVKWEHFTSKLEPGKKETWTAVVRGPDAAKVAAEMVATLYDASLDQYLPHDWMQNFGVFRREAGSALARFENSIVGFDHLWGGWRPDPRGVSAQPYRRYPADISTHIWLERKGMTFKLPGLGGIGGRAVSRMSAAAPACDAAPKREEPADLQQEAAHGKGSSAPTPDLDQVTARKNLAETAFFFPHILAGADGTVRLEFTMPEALTEWKFLGFAHDKDLRSGFLTDKAVTAKDLMVEPNPPRFVREGDTIEFTVKVSNQSAGRQAGSVRLSLADARTLGSVDKALGNTSPEQSFDLPSKESRSLSWRLTVPDGLEVLTYTAVGSTGRVSDGEEGVLPVLSRRILVHEALPLPVRGAQTKAVAFTKLLESKNSTTLQHQNLTVQMVSQPAWYAVMALPYLMEYPYECSEQVFNRLYANALARHIAGSDPKIRRIFDLWKATPALDSPLEKNQDLKAVQLEETPWLQQAKAESQARRAVGLLFDANRMDDEAGRVFAKLAERQLDDGLWPWFPGCRGDEYISTYIAAGFGRLRHLGVQGVDVSLALKAFGGLDPWMARRHAEILRHPKPEEYVPSPIDAFYLYGRSFFLKDRPIAREHQAAVDFFLARAKQHWLRVDSRQSQGHLALALKRFGDAQTPQDIMRSIKEHAVTSEEMGMFWRDTELSWWWFRAPIETQALMIEAFDEILADAQAVEDAKVWLLKQKQTQDWKTTKATADAVYGLLLRGTNLLASDALVEVSLAGTPIKPEKVEAGTGFYEQRFSRSEIRPDMGTISVTKTDAGVSWGSVHWQYLEDMGKVTPYEGTPLSLKKAFFRKVVTTKGQVLEPVAGPLAVGDELVCRVELRTDRDMEYVHLKDQRPSGTEPVDVLSQAKYQDGLAYYQSTRDTASHFFIHYLPKGTYVFEYSVRVQLKGSYQGGMASVQCMYAPEFGSHSGSTRLEVR